MFIFFKKDKPQRHENEFLDHPIQSLTENDFGIHMKSISIQFIKLRKNTRYA
ncbi:hypothetical protein P872_16470 [Rhodonellum psychrophilum GCM71 = DSM 17998]|uniref:Uncharacterized protein n=2 Tax=Rhodonellum TaxID=336827 RepID=U5C4Y8_9BACT|nr:hypothetical protein P872_16470 [Rhodonellum psychrophilum GCM71 = DSM 17998]SDZ50445.1 hypothetical protein SAMN05444412_11850 [Rhodonellum ikkaensis]